MRSLEMGKRVEWVKENLYDFPRIRDLTNRWIAEQPLRLGELQELKTDAEKRQKLALVGVTLSSGLLVFAIASFMQNNDSLKLAAAAPLFAAELLEVDFAIYFNGKLYQMKNLIKNARLNPQAS